MATYKRRIIYMSDDEWSTIREVSRNHDQTISECIRQQIGLLPSEAFRETPAQETLRVFGEVAAEAENAMADLGHAFRSRPFTPVPKKGK